MQGILYEETSILYFAFVTLVLGGAAAWMTGRACALTWRPVWTLVLYLLLVGAGVRFIHFSIFEGTLLSLHYYAVDTIILEIIGFMAYRHTRAEQMTRQYYWLYERAGWFAWKPRAAG